MTPLQILHEASRNGLRLSIMGDKLAVEPVHRCPAALMPVLREHKAALLRLLALPPDQRAWLHVCQQVLDGEFDNADRSTVASVTIGLNPLVAVGITEAVAAMERLESIHPRARTR